MTQLDRIKEKLRAIVVKATGLSDPEVDAVLQMIEIEFYTKGTVLLSQGDRGQSSYYVAAGCLSQYFVSEAGKEVSVEFYTDEQAVNTLGGLDLNGLSLFSYACLEDTYLLSCPYEIIREVEMSQTPFSPMIRGFFYSELSNLQRNYAQFKGLSPEERFIQLMNQRRELFWRVPQHLLASYLDISPETFSRYKKRFFSTES